MSAPAKLNLYLRVLGKRPDGYHEIETLFERIDLADTLMFEAHANELRLTCDDPTLSCGEDNLVLKAARLLQVSSGTAWGAKIHLMKRIPVAAGLGGGSSDAAAALCGLNTLWELGLTPSELLRLAAQLGSDVPCFLTPSPYAIGRGRGEQCATIDQMPRLAHVLVVPNARLSTKEIYKAWDRARIGSSRLSPSPQDVPTTASALAPYQSGAGPADNSMGRYLTTAPPSITMVVHALRNGPAMAGLADGLWNDLEPEAIRRCPVIATIESRLRDLGCCGALLSGSGPSVFGLCRDVAQAQEIAGSLRSLAGGSWRSALIQTLDPEGSSVLHSRS